MTKAAMTVVLFTIGCISSAYAQDSSKVIGDAFDQFRKEQNEERTVINKHEQAIDALRKQVAANNTAAPASAATLAPAATGSIDYTRYDRLVRDCVGIWTPDPAKKDEEAKKLNDKLEIEFVSKQQYCLRKQTEAAAQKEEAANRARAAQQIAQPTQNVLPPAPGAIQDDQPDATTADLRDDRDAVPAPEQTMYYRPGYRSVPFTTAQEEKVLRDRARRMLGERGIEGAYSHQTMRDGSAPRPGCVPFGSPVRDPAGYMHQRWHCQRGAY